MNDTAPGRAAASTLAYGGMLFAVVVVFLVVRHYGEMLEPPPPLPSAAAAGGGSATSSVLWHLLLALAAVVTLGRALGVVFRAIGQPPVIGEVVGGILLGPSLLGRVSPDAAAYLLPADVAPFLGVLAQLGVIIYMFLVGLELSPDSLRSQLRTTVAISHASIVVPFLMGAGLALFLYPRFSSSVVPFTHFALFIGVAMSITAFPVLARILADRHMTRTRLGALALTCAAIGDVTAWCLLAFAVGVATGAAGSALLVALLTVAFIALMFVVVRPRLERLARASQEDRPTQGAVTITLIALLVAALATEAIGVHGIFGAFLLGAVIPHDSPLARSLHQGVTDLVTVLFLPAFFAFTGMRTEIGLLASGYEWLVCLLIIAVATAGKLAGTMTASRLAGMDLRDAAALGILMNTRGLMEVIVLNVGLDLGVISPTLFTMLVLMALVTTVMTTPLLQVLRPSSLAPADAGRRQEVGGRR
jgi:Kef-type K+ transport system membrane component KefB